MNDDNIRKELERLRNSLKHETDTGIARVIKRRIADLERDLEKYKDRE